MSRKRKAARDQRVEINEPKVARYQWQMLHLCCTKISSRAGWGWGGVRRRRGGERTDVREGETAGNVHGCRQCNAPSSLVLRHKMDFLCSRHTRKADYLDVCMCLRRTQFFFFAHLDHARPPSLPPDPPPPQLKNPEGAD